MSKAKDSQSTKRYLKQLHTAPPPQDMPAGSRPAIRREAREFIKKMQWRKLAKHFRIKPKVSFKRRMAIIEGLREVQANG